MKYLLKTITVLLFFLTWWWVGTLDLGSVYYYMLVGWFIANIYDKGMDGINDYYN